MTTFPLTGSVEWRRTQITLTYTDDGPSTPSLSSAATNNRSLVPDFISTGAPRSRRLSVMSPVSLVGLPFIRSFPVRF